MASERTSASERVAHVVLRAGTHLRSQVDPTQVIVTRAPSPDLVVQCGGVDMVAFDGTSTTPSTALTATAGTLLGKRYADELTGLEVLCVGAGSGGLSVGGRALLEQSPRPLPASD